MKLQNVPMRLAAAAAIAVAGAGALQARAASVTVTSYAAPNCLVGAMYRLEYLAIHYPWCVPGAGTTAVAYASYPYRVYQYGHAPYVAGWGYAYYPAYATYPYAGAAWSPYGAAARGPYGGFAATTGAYANSTGGVTRAGTVYNPWTGNGAAARTSTAYDPATGSRAVGQRGAVGNAYTGDYAYGERGAVYNERTGAAAAGSHGTVGNAWTGREANVGRGVVYDPNSGQANRVGGIQGENGGVGHVNNQVYVNRNGNTKQFTVGNGTKTRRTHAGRPR